jgi:hypothetical protein
MMEYIKNAILIDGILYNISRKQCLKLRNISKNIRKYKQGINKTSFKSMATSLEEEKSLKKTILLYKIFY